MARLPSAPFDFPLRLVPRNIPGWRRVGTLSLSDRFYLAIHLGWHSDARGESSLELPFLGIRAVVAYTSFQIGLARGLGAWSIKYSDCVGLESRHLCLDHDRPVGGDRLGIVSLFST